MRLLTIPVFFALCASVIAAESAETPLGSTGVPSETATEELEDAGPAPTIFNGMEVPPIPEIDGEKFNTTVAEGYWFVKHYSSVHLSHLTN
jgi:protein disulfide-isomerase